MMYDAMAEKVSKYRELGTGSENGDVSKKKVLNELWILLKVVMPSSGFNILVSCSF